MNAAQTECDELAITFSSGHDQSSSHYHTITNRVCKKTHRIPHRKPCLPTSYSPNSFCTRFKTLSFAGSYGWSFAGISSSAGKAWVYLSTMGLIFSAMCWLMSKIAMSLRSDVKWLNVDSMSATDVYEREEEEGLVVGKGGKERGWEGLPCYQRS